MSAFRLDPPNPRSYRQPFEFQIKSSLPFTGTNLVPIDRQTNWRLTRTMKIADVRRDVIYKHDDVAENSFRAEVPKISTKCFLIRIMKFLIPSRGS